MGKLLAIEYDELIQGEKFINLQNGINIIYKHTHEVNDFFKSPPKNDFILISHNSDGKVKNGEFRTTQGSSNDADISNIPKNLIKWYSQNVCVKNEKIESIPIGLENSEWFPHLHKKEKILNYRNLRFETKNLLYVCHNIKTNPKEREKPYEIFKDINWVTLKYGINGNNYDDYLHNIKTHKFTLCPEGNGTDTHRLWETLYLGSIPIEKRNINNSFYEDLPICFVNDWADITEDFLNYEYNRITNKKWNIDKLKFSFWKNKIKKELC